MNNELQEHKTSDKIKWILTLISFIVVGVMLAGIILGWFEKKDKPEKQDDNQIVVTPQESKTAMRLNASRAAASGNSYTITATVTPSDATNTNIDWSISWKNGSSSWANGKSVSDYITIAPDGNSATVTLKNAFSEQCIVTAASESNPEATATCTVDYIERLNIPHGNGYMDVKRIYQNGNTDQTFVFDTAMNIKPIVQYSGIGTVRGTVSFDKLTVKLDSTIQDYINGEVEGSGTQFTFKNLLFDMNGTTASVEIASPTSFCFLMNTTAEQQGKIVNAFITACNSHNGKIRFESKFTYSYNGTTIQTGQVIGDFAVDTNGLAIAVTGVSLDTGNITF